MEAGTMCRAQVTMTKMILVISKTMQLMKKIFSSVMLVAAAAMAFISCQKQEVNAPEEVKVEGLNFSAEKPEFADASKTEWTGETIQWSEGDKIRVAYTAGGVWQNGDGTATSDEENGKKTARIYVSNSVKAGETASFSVPGNFTIPTGADLEFYGVYPSTAASDASMPYAPSVTVTIPAEQKPLANSFDSKADLMAAKSVSTYILSDENPLPEAIPLMWTRLVAHGHLTLKNLKVEEGEKLQTITLTADKDADMVGEHYLYLDTHDVEKAAGNNAANSLTVKADNLTIADGGNVTFWACFRPCTWKSVNVVVETDKATYTREIDLSTNQKTFAQNARNTLAINMATAVREAKTALSLPFVRDFSDRSGKSEITELDGFSSIDGKVYNAEKAIRLASGSADGSITTQPLDLSQNFHVIVTACGWSSGELKMTVSAGEQTENITLTTYGADEKPGTWKDYVINFDSVGPTASVQFSAVEDYRYFIQKIQILEGHAELTPVLSATSPDQMSAEGGEGSFKYTLSNPKDGEVVTATENVDWIDIVTVDQETGTVSYTVSKNTSETVRQATITLSYKGAESKTVTITQAAAQSGGVETKVYAVTYTVASATSVTVSGEAPAGSSATFKNTHTSNKQQMTKDNSQTYTLSGYDGCTITGISLSMKSNSSGGAGTLSVKAGSKTIASIADSNFKTENWNGAWSTSFVDINPSVTETLVGTGENVVVEIKASANSLFCQSITITYELNGNAGGGGTVDPDQGEGTDPTTKVLLSEEFDNSSTTDSNADLGTTISSTFSNFTTSSYAYKSKFGGLKFGKSSVAGSITTKQLDLTKPFKVSLKVKGWTSVEGKIKITCGSQSKELTYTSTSSDSYETVSAEFSAASSTSQVVIGTTAKRAYIDDVVIEYID